jgi:cytochrome c oxidase subunit 2
VIQAKILPLFVSGLWTFLDWFDPTKPRWLPPRASSVAGDVDLVFDLIFWICAFFYVLIVVLAITFAVRFRHTNWRPRAHAAPLHNTPLEIAWSVIPLVLVVMIFGLSTKVWLDMTQPAAGRDSRRVQVTARKWSWWFDHEGGKGSNDLHVVADEQIELVMAADDVLHSLYVPAFRIKQDVVPGRYTKMYFRATRPGTYPIYCAEFCGTDHSLMLANVVVHPNRAAYDEWARGQDTSAMPLPELGRQIYDTRGCAGCHSTDGTRRVGPSLRRTWGTTENIEGGGTAPVDENYIRESILEPRAKIVAGYPPTMPPMPLTERELQGVIEFIKSLD